MAPANEQNTMPSGLGLVLRSGRNSKKPAQQAEASTEGQDASPSQIAKQEEAPLELNDNEESSDLAALNGSPSSKDRKIANLKQGFYETNKRLWELLTSIGKISTSFEETSCETLRSVAVKERTKLSMLIASFQSAGAELESAGVDLDNIEAELENAGVDLEGIDAEYESAEAGYESAD